MKNIPDIAKLVFCSLILVTGIFGLYIFYTRTSTISNNPENWHETFEFLTFLLVPVLTLIGTYLIFRQSQRDSESDRFNLFLAQLNAFRDTRPKFDMKAAATSRDWLPGLEITQALKDFVSLQSQLKFHNFSFYKVLAEEQMKVNYESFFADLLRFGVIFDNVGTLQANGDGSTMNMAIWDFLDATKHLRKSADS